MNNIYLDNLIQKAINSSESSDWENAVKEWEILDCIDDENAESLCICGKENIKYLFTIINIITKKTLF